MSYIASIIIRDAAEKPEDVATQAKNLIASYFSSEKEFPSVRVHVTPIKQRRDLGIIEIDISQSRERERLDLLKKIFMKLCAETDWGMALKSCFPGILNTCVDPAAMLTPSYSTRIPMRNKTTLIGKGKLS